MHVNESISGIRGRVGLWRVRQRGKQRRRDGLERWVEPITCKPNQIQYHWGFIAAQTIGKGLAKYRLSAMYIEFENVASPGDPVTVPAFGRDEGTEYYDALQSSGTLDFLRVPLLQEPMLGIVSGFEDYFTAGETGNRATFFAQSQGVVGVHGKTFSDVANSKVYGVALVATPVFADRTQDVVFARTYFSLGEQTLKEASSQIGISWDIDFL